MAHIHRAAKMAQMEHHVGHSWLSAMCIALAMRNVHGTSAEAENNEDALSDDEDESTIKVANPTLDDDTE
jgi:hypothetical protein